MTAKQASESFQLIQKLERIKGQRKAIVKEEKVIVDELKKLFPADAEIKSSTNQLLASVVYNTRKILNQKLAKEMLGDDTPMLDSTFPKFLVH